MTLKVGMQHRVLEYYKVCSNDDPGLTLTSYTARSNLTHYAFVCEKGKPMDFSATMVVYDIKVGRCSQLNEYMKLIIMSTKDQGNSLTLVQISQIQYFLISFPQQPLGQLKPNFMWRLLGTEEQKHVQMVLVT